MRHSNIELTMQVYTDPKLLDVLGAIDSLPQLPLVDNTEVMVQASMGTDDVPSQRHGPKFAPGFALNPHNRGQSMATQDKCSELDDSIQESKKSRNQCDLQAFSQSGRLDLNQHLCVPNEKALSRKVLNRKRLRPRLILVAPIVAPAKRIWSKLTPIYAATFRKTNAADSPNSSPVSAKAVPDPAPRFRDSRP